MKKTYYIQTLKKFSKELKALNERLGNMEDEDKKAVCGLLESLGFAKKQEGGYGMPAVRSIWGVRAHSKKLIAYNDLVQYISQGGTDLDIDDFTEDQLDQAVEVIAHHPDYAEHVHQDPYILDSGVEYLEDLLEEDDDEDSDEEEDSENEGEGECKGIRVIAVSSGSKEALLEKLLKLLEK